MTVPRTMRKEINRVEGRQLVKHSGNRIDVRFETDVQPDAERRPFQLLAVATDGQSRLKRNRAGDLAADFNRSPDDGLHGHHSSHEVYSRRKVERHWVRKR